MLTQLTASEISDLVRTRKASAVEVAQAHLDRIQTQDGDYGAFLTVDAEKVLAEAKAVDERVANGFDAPLVGVPVALKDNISTRGIRTTCASRILENYVPPFDATVTERLREGGLVMIGKTNLDEFAMGTSCENSALGQTRNTWDTDLVPGGSSGGSAVAVSAEFSPVSLGSDTGGSIRLPAALTGTVGFKPTYGRVSRYGLVAFGSSLDQIGPFARNVEDAARCAHVISGHDPRDATSIPESQIRIDDLKSGSIRGKKIALPKELFGGDIDPAVMDVVQICIDVLKREGVEFTEVSLPSVSYGVTTYYIIAPAEASSNLGRFDGIRFGPRIDSDGHISMVSATRGSLFGPEVKLRIMVGTYALSAGYYDAYYHRAQQVRGLMVSEFEKAFSEFDAVLSPTSPVVAFKLGEITDPMKLKLLDLCTIPANMGGFPSISLPCGLAHDLPVGMQLTGPVMGDEALLSLSYAIDRALDRDYRRPPIL